MHWGVREFNTLIRPSIWGISRINQEDISVFRFTIDEIFDFLANTPPEVALPKNFTQDSESASYFT